MRLSELLNLAVNPPYPGPRPGFTEVHVLMAIEAIRDYGPVGRGRLARIVGLGGGSIKTLIDRLRAMDIVYISQRGCMLSRFGEAVGGVLRELMPVKLELDPMPIFIGKRGYGILVRGFADKVKSGIEQRDAAIKVGAFGATTVVCRDGELFLPPSFSLSSGYPNVDRILVGLFNPVDGDVIVIGGADDHLTARYGAFAAALTLIGDVTAPFSER